MELLIRACQNLLPVEETQRAFFSDTFVIRLLHGAWSVDGPKAFIRTHISFIANCKLMIFTSFRFFCLDLNSLFLPLNQ